MQEDLVEAMQLWWRAPGGRRPPFATDGPWRLIREEDRALPAERKLWAEAEGKNAAPPPRRLPLSVAEVAMRDRVSEWLLLAPEADRQLIVIVLGELARGVKRVSWKKVRQRLDAEISPSGLGMRYSRSMTRIAVALSKRREPRPWAGEGEADMGLADALKHPSRR